MSQDEFAGDRDSHDRAIIQTMARYDMLGSLEEDYYARQYLHWMLPEIQGRFPDGRVRIVDLGCGQGRLAIPLARWALEGGGKVVGVDLAGPALERAREHARGMENLEFLESDLMAFLRTQARDSADVALLIEVTFFLPTWRDVLREMARVLRPGGLSFVAFRSQYYNLLQTVWSWRWEGAKMALEQREGYLWGEPVWYTWQTPKEISQVHGEIGLRLLGLKGIGVCSGLEEDPHGTIIRPSRLSAEEQELLMSIECAAAEEYACCGRYILAIGDKPRSL